VENKSLFFSPLCSKWSKVEINWTREQERAVFCAPIGQLQPEVEAALKNVI
jgi:hypothetical protein